MQETTSLRDLHEALRPLGSIEFTHILRVFVRNSSSTFALLNRPFEHIVQRDDQPESVALYALLNHGDRYEEVALHTNELKTEGMTARIKLMQILRHALASGPPITDFQTAYVGLLDSFSESEDDLLAGLRKAMEVLRKVKVIS